MVYLILTVVTMTLWNFIFRGAQKRDADMLSVGSINYICAAAACWVVAALWGGGPPTHATIILGIVQGAIYVISFFFLIPAMSYKGISIVIAFTRLAVIVPVLASVIVWRETPNVLQGLGVLGAVISLPLLSLDKRVGNGRLSGREIGVLLGLFATNGIALVTSKWFSKLGMPEQTLHFLAIMFSTAAAGSFAPYLTRRLRTGPVEIGWGAGLGLANASCNLLLLLALGVLPGVIVFPVNACGGIVLTALIAAGLWREIPGRRGLAGLGLAGVALVLINLT